MGIRKESAPSAHRSLAIIAAAGALGFSAYTLKECSNDGSNPTITAESTVDRIMPSTEDPLLDIFGTTSAEAEEYTKFLGKKVPLTGRSSSVTSNGVIEIRAKNNALNYGVYRLEQTNPASSAKYGIKATLDLDNMYIRPSLSTLFRDDGKPMVSAKQEILAMRNLYGTLKRQAIAAEAAKIHFIHSCGRSVLSGVSGSVKKRAKDDALDQSKIVEGLPGGEEEVALRKQIASEEVKVVFTRIHPTTKRKVVVNDLSDIILNYQVTSKRGSPIKPLVNEKAALEDILKSSEGAENVNIITGGPCKFSGPSAAKLAELSGERNPGA